VPNGYENLLSIIEKLVFCAFLMLSCHSWEQGPDEEDIYSKSFLGNGSECF